MDERLQSLIAEVLEISPGDVVPDLERADTEQWDSLNHLRLIAALEEEFGVRLTMDQIAAVHTVRELQQFIDGREVQR